VAIVMHLTGASRMEAVRALRSSGGHVRWAIEQARGEE